MHGLVQPLILIAYAFTSAHCTTFDLPPRNQVSIHHLSVEKSDQPSNTAAIPPDHALDTGGTGCRDGSVTHVFNPDATLLTLVFSEFTASLDPKDAQHRDKARRFCGVNLGFKVPANWTFEVRELDWRGYVDVDAGVKGILRTVYFWRGDRERDERVAVRKIVNGPKHVDLSQTMEKKSKEGRTRLPCERKEGGSMLHVNTVVRVCYEGECSGRDTIGIKDVKRNGGGMVTVDSLDAKFKTHMQLDWKKC